MKEESVVPGTEISGGRVDDAGRMGAGRRTERRHAHVSCEGWRRTTNFLVAG